MRSSLIAILTSLLALCQQPAAPGDEATSFHVDASLVEVYASVFDSHDNPLPNLTRDRFQIFDGGQPQHIAYFEGSQDKVSCAVMLDVTGSMEAFLPKLKNAVVRFVDELRDEEEVGLYTFTTSLRLVQPYTSDKKSLKQAVLRTRAAGGTALFDAVSNVTRELEMRKGKKALILFTDGADNASTLNAFGASRQARLSGVPIYTIAEGEALGDHTLLKTLEDLATRSGGLPFHLNSADKIDEIFSSIVRNLSHTYLVAWKLPENAGQSWRPIKLVVSGERDARIRARQGYFPQ